MNLKYIYWFVLFIYLLILSITSIAQTTTWTGTTNSDWNEVTNWDNGIPTSTYDVIITNSGFTPEVTSSFSINSLNINASSILNIGTSGDLVITNDITNSGTINITDGNISIANIVNNASGFISISATRIFSFSGNFTNNGTLNSSSGALLELTGTSVQVFSGTGTTDIGTLNSLKTSGTIIFNKNVIIEDNLTIPTLNTITLGLGVTLSLGGNITNNGTLDVSSLGNTVRFIGNTNVNISALGLASYQNIEIAKSSGFQVTFDQDITLAGGLNIISGNMSLGVGRTLEVTEDFTNDGSFSADATSTLELMGTGTQALSGSSGFSLGLVNINKTSGTVSFDQDITMVGSLTIPSGVTLQLDASRQLNLAGDITNNGTFLANATSTTELTGTGNHIISGTGSFTFPTLSLNKTAGNVTFAQSATITNNFTIPTGVTTTLNTGLTLSFQGSLNNLGTFTTASGSTVEFEGGGAHTLSGAGIFTLPNLIVDKTGGSLDINSDVAISNDLTISNGTLNLTSGQTIALTGNLSINGSFSTVSGSAFEVNGTGTNTITGVGSISFDTFTLDKTTGSVVLAQDVSVTQDFIIPSGVTTTLNSGQTLTLSNNFTNNGTFDNTPTGNTIEFDGTSVISLSGTGLSTFRNLIINKTGSGSVTIDQDVTVNEDFTVTSGTLNLNASRTLQVQGDVTNDGDFSADATSTLELMGTGNQTLNGINGYNLGLVNINKTSGTVSFDQDITLVGSLTIPSGVTLQLEAGHQLSLDGDFTSNGTFSANATSTTEFTGTGNHTISGTGTLSFPTLSLNKTAGNVTFAQSTTVINDFTVPTGVATTLNAGLTLFLQGSLSNLGTFTTTAGSTVEFEGTGTHTLSGTGTFTFPNMIIDKTTGSLDVNSDINISNDLTITSGTLNLPTGQTIILTGNLSINGTFSAATGSIFEVNGTGTNTITGVGSITFDTFNINKTTGSVVLAQDISVIQDFTIPTGVTTTLNSGQTLILSNNFINNGTFDNTPTGNTIEFDGTSVINLSGTGLSTFRNLIVNKTGSGSVTIDQDVTVNENLTVTSGTFNLNVSRTLQVQGNFTNNGNNFASSAGSIVELIGTNNQSIEGTGQIQFDILQVSKTGGLILIDRNPVTVVQDFTIPSGVSFQIGGGDNFDIYNDFENNGTVLNNAGGVRFIGAGTAELRGTGVMNFRDVFIQKTGTGNNVDITVPVNVSSWLIINTSSQMTLQSNITVGGAGSIARMQNHGTVVHNNNSFIVEGTGDYNVQGNTETEFYEIQITKTTGTLIFEQHADILQAFTVPTGVTLRVEDNIDLRLEGDLIMNGTNDNSQSASGIHFTGTNDATVSGIGVPINFRNFFNQKTNNNTVTLTVNTEYLYNFQTDAGNTTRIEDGLTTFVQNDTDTRIYGTLSLGNNVTMNYNSGNTEVRIENGGNFVQDLGSTNTIVGRVRVQNGGTFTVSNGSTLINTGRVFHTANGGVINLTANSNLTIYRDLQLNNTAVLNFDNTSWIEFQGGDNADIETGNTNLNIPNLRINKTGNVVDLRRQVTVTNYLDLVSSHINSDDTYRLVFADGATHSGGSTASYIQGPARKIGNTSFEFPIGKNNRFGKLELQVNSAGASTDYFDAEYFGTIFLNTSLASPLTDVSDNEYWQIERSGTTQVTVVLHWTDDLASGIGPTAITESDLRVAQWNDTNLEWEDRGNTTGIPTNSLASNANQNTFDADRYWTLAYTGGDNDNWGATTWIGGVSDDWDDANNWQPAVVPDITINAIIIGDRALTGNNDPNKKLGSTAVVKNLYMPRVIFPTGVATTQKPQLTVDASFTIQVGDGSANTGLVECYGDIINNGTINCTDNFNVYDEAEVTNNSIIEVGDDFLIYDTSIFNNNNGASTTINDRFYSYDDIQVINEGTFEVENRLETRDNSIIHNQSTGTFSVLTDRMYFYNSSNITNDGIFQSGRQIDIRNSVVLNNNATITTGIEAGQAGTFSMTNDATLNNALGATITLTTNPASSFFLNNNVTVDNDGTLTSGRQFELQAGGVNVMNDGLIRFRQDFRNNGTFTGIGTIEVYDNHTDTRIYGTSTTTTPFIIHQFLINRTGGKITQERSCRWTNDVTVPANVEYEILTGLNNNTIEGDFTIDATATFDLQGTAQIFLEGNMTNNGTATLNNSTVEFQGSTDKLINGSSTTNFYNLINNKTSAITDVEGTIVVENDLTNTAGTLNISSGFSTTLQNNFINNSTFNAEANSLVSFTGTANSDISGSSTIDFADLTINKTSADVNLSREVEVSEHLDMLSGLITNSNTHNFIVNDNGTSNGGNATSYVDGPIRKVGDDAFVFPVGKLGRWARIEISDLANTNVNDHFTAEYFPWHTSPIPTDAAFVNAPLNHVSSKEHWTLTRSGATEAKVTLYWEDGAFSEIEDDLGVIDLTVAHWNGSAWEDAGQDNITGTTASGNITSNIQNDFSPFTFGSITGTSPLPITLLEFNAEKDNQQAKISWTTLSEKNVSHFEIERSTDALSFETILQKDTDGESNERRDYIAYDNAPLQGLNYYRLKSVDNDGSVQYSPIRAVNFEEIIDLAIDKIYPNPFVEELNLHFNINPQTAYQLILLDMQGKLVLEKKGQSEEATLVEEKLNLPQLSSGTYILKLITKDKKVMKRVIKI